ncbi:hypothetical protein GCM10027035_02530 [Emticicia sediminis]
MIVRLFFYKLCQTWFYRLSQTQIPHRYFSYEGFIVYRILVQKLYATTSTVTTSINSSISISTALAGFSDNTSNESACTS